MKRDQQKRPSTRPTDTLLTPQLSPMCQERPIHIKRDQQTSQTKTWKETNKRDLHINANTPTKKTYKRDPQIIEKRPTQETHT